MERYKPIRRTPEYWKNWAIEIKIVASDADDEETRKRLLRFASTCEKMANLGKIIEAKEAKYIQKEGKVRDQ